MTNSPASQVAAGLLTAAVISDDDVLGRVAAVIDPAVRQHRTLWLIFLERDGTQADLAAPVDGLPDRPGTAAAEHVCYLASESIAQAPGLVSVIITLTRAGALQRTDADRHLLRALQHGASRYATPVRMLCLATPQGVRELGPVRPTRLVGPAHARDQRAGHSVPNSRRTGRA
jgi:hypothetical protein